MTKMTPISAKLEDMALTNKKIQEIIDLRKEMAVIEENRGQEKYSSKAFWRLSQGRLEFLRENLALMALQLESIHD